MASRGAAEYAATYHEQLHRALVVASVLGVLTARFVLRSTLVELLCAAAFVLLELLPALLPFGMGSALLWSSERVQAAVNAYEAVVFNSLWDLNELLPLGGLGLLVLLLLRRCFRSRRRGPAGCFAGAVGGAGSMGSLQVVVAKAE